MYIFKYIPINIHKYGKKRIRTNIANGKATKDERERQVK